MGFRATMVSQTQHQLLTIAKATARSVEEFLSMHSETLQAIARDTLAWEQGEGKTSSLVRGGKFDHLAMFYEVRNKDVDAIRLLDSGGVVLCRYGTWAGKEDSAGVSLADMPGISYVLREQKIHISKVYQAMPGGLAIMISEPVFHENELKGVIQRMISIHVLSKRFVQAVELRGGGYAWMFDDNDIVLSHPEKEFVGLSVSEIVREMHRKEGEVLDRARLHGHILQDHDYLHRVKAEDGGVGVSANCKTHEDELIAYASVAIGAKNWNLVVALPYHEIAGPINDHAQNIFGLAGAVLLLLGIGGAFLIRSEKRKSQFETEARYLKQLAKSAEALRQGERRFRDLVENSLTGIFIIQDGQVMYKNPEQERLFGPLPEPFRFTDFGNIHPDDAKEFRLFYQRVLSGDVKALDTEVRFYPIEKTDQGVDVRWVHCRASLIEYQGKDAVLVNMMDITRAKELEHLVIMKQKMVSLGHVAAGIAHEVRNPLSGINIYLATLKKLLYDPDSFHEEDLHKANKIVEQIQSASGKIESVIRRVMDFSKPGHPRLALTDINKSIEEAIKLSSVALRKSGIRIEKSLAEDLPQCHADRHLIEQVVLNLITNAAQAMKKTDGRREIEIASSLETNHVVIRVADSGPGVSRDVRDKIFDPFFTTKSDSSGIGLSLSHRIITDHGGSLEVTSSKWGGAEFRIEIPLIKD
jgi:PAS domain S-box-containing protein